MAGWGSGFLVSGAILGMRWVLFAGRTVTVLVVIVYAVTVFVAHPGAGARILKG